MDKATADSKAAALRAVVPTSWDVEVRNTEIRPGHPGRYKVVAQATGLVIVAVPDTGRFFVTIDNGPGIVEAVANREFTGIGADRGWDDAATAFGKLKDTILTRYARVCVQSAHV